MEEIDLKRTKKNKPVKSKEKVLEEVEEDGEISFEEMLRREKKLEKKVRTRG